MKITIAGEIGSGKSEVRRELGRLTGWSEFSTGEAFRQIAARLDLSVLELNRYAKGHPEVDDEVDDHLRRLATVEEPTIVDSRMAWAFLPSSLKAYLVVDPEISAARVFAAGRSDERYESAKEALAHGSQRQEAEQERYNALYSVDCGNWRNYDIVVDTSHASPNRVARVIVKTMSDPSDDTTPLCWISPKRLVPTQDIRSIARPPAASVRQAAAQEGINSLPPIQIAVSQSHCFIVDGHARASYSLSKNHDLVRCQLVAFEEEHVLPGLTATEFAQEETLASWLYDWEDAHRFSFPSYPQWLHS